MRYKVGMYGGCFDLLHLGHINNIVQASAQCEVLHIILCHNPVRDRIDYRVRYRWLRETCGHLPNIKIHCIEDVDTSKEQCNWEDGAEKIRAVIGTEIDVVFCGSDYIGTEIFENLYPNSAIRYFSRYAVPVSSTEIFDSPMKYWDYIPKVARYFFAKKVLVIGGESTGKSVLCQNLALAYNTNFVEEYGRYTCERAGGEDFMTAEDLYENLIMQKAEIYKAQMTANKLLFVDTDALTTAFYAELLNEGEVCENLATLINTISNWDLVLFLEPTVPFVQDGTRSDRIAEERKQCSDMLKSYYERAGVPFEIISGDYLTRYQQAQMLIKYHCGV